MLFKLKIIEATHTADLAINFGRKVRDLIDREDYRDLFPETELKADSRSAGKWLTNKGGEYYAAGIGGALAGRGADLFIIDDPHSEQDAMSDKAMDEAFRQKGMLHRNASNNGQRLLTVKRSPAGAVLPSSNVG